MKLSYQDFEKIIHAGIALTSENNANRLLDSILLKAMEITNCVVSALYLYEDQLLNYRMIKLISGSIFGKNGSSVIMPSLELSEENVCAYCAKQREIVNIPDIAKDQRFDVAFVHNFNVMTGIKVKSMLVIPLENNEKQLIGVLQMMNAQDKDGNIIAFDPQCETIIRSLGSMTAIKLTNIRYLEEIREQLHSFVEALATAIDERTPYNGNHTRKVAEYTMLLAEKVNEKYRAGVFDQYFDDDRKEKLKLAALLHDIGKIVVPRSVMNRATRVDKDMPAIERRFQLLAAYYELDYLKGRITKEEFERQRHKLDDYLKFVHAIDTAKVLSAKDLEKVNQLATEQYVQLNGEIISYITSEEYSSLKIRTGTLSAENRKLMEEHVVMTSKILSKVHFNKHYEMVPVWAGEHHELLDGSGYPKHLKGQELPLETRMLTIADIYDALTATDRPYKDPMPRDQVFAVLRKMAQQGKIDAQLVEWMDEAIEA